jgi:hypothetical protein
MVAAEDPVAQNAPGYFYGKIELKPPFAVQMMCMRSRPWRAPRLAGALAFVFTIMIGIAAGCACAVEEDIESFFRSNRREFSRRTRQ